VFGKKSVVHSSEKMPLKFEEVEPLFKPESQHVVGAAMEVKLSTTDGH
jgi:hypothetical protein